MFLAGLEVVRDTSNVRERLQISLLILNEVKRIKFHSLRNHRKSYGFLFSSGAERNQWHGMG